MKKRVQNGKRTAGKAAAREPEQKEPQRPGEALRKHLQRVLSAIEGRPVSMAEVDAMVLRQRGIGESGPGGYDASRSDEHPP
jgi:hypothetical protein